MWLDDIWYDMNVSPEPELPETEQMYEPHDADDWFLDISPRCNSAPHASDQPL